MKEIAGTAGEENTVRVYVGPHIGIHPPGRSEADGPSSRKDYTKKSNKKDDEDDDPIASFPLRGFLFFRHSNY